MRRLILVFFILLLLLPVACTEPAEPSTNTETTATTAPADGGFDRRAMLENITMQVILPAHEDLVQTLAALETAVNTFTADPTEETLTAVQSAWLAANLARMAVLPFRIGPVDDSLLHNRLDNRPPRLKFIDETVIAGEEAITADYLASIGSSSVGLGAMEYLLFDPQGGNTAVLETFTSADYADRQRLFLQQLAANAHQRGRELALIWTADGDNYAQSFIEAAMDGGELQGSMNMLINQMIADIEGIVASRLGKPSGQRSNGLARPDLVEAAYSQASLTRIITTIAGVQIAFNGADGLGFDDYLDYLGATHEDQTLSAVINKHFAATIAALKAIDGPLATAVDTDPDQVNAAIEEVRTLLVLLKVDLPNQLGVTLTFNDNDGD